MKRILSFTLRIGLAACAMCHSSFAAERPLNILFLTADDLNHDSLGVTGGPIKDLTPHIDRLAADGLRFEYAYSTVAVCQPVRQIMFTGLYPHRNGSMGFFPVKPHVQTFNERLRDAGYLISRYGKGRASHAQREILHADVADDIDQPTSERSSPMPRGSSCAMRASRAGRFSTMSIATIRIGRSSA
jgi:hypothetical protein